MNAITNKGEKVGLLFNQLHKMMHYSNVKGKKVILQLKLYLDNDVSLTISNLWLLELLKSKVTE